MPLTWNIENKTVKSKYKRYNIIKGPHEEVCKSLQYSQKILNWSDPLDRKCPKFIYISKLKIDFSSLYIVLYTFSSPYLQRSSCVNVSLVHQFCEDLIQRDDVRYGAINSRCRLHWGPRQSRDGVAVPVALSVFVPQTAGRHQTAGAAAVAASVSGCQRAAARRARRLPQHWGRAIRKVAVEEQVRVLWRRGRCGRRGSHHHVVMLKTQEEKRMEMEARCSKRVDLHVRSWWMYLIVALKEGEKI